jgi:hypothetical protein
LELDVSQFDFLKKNASIGFGWGIFFEVGERFLRIWILEFKAYTVNTVVDLKHQSPKG